MPDRTDTIATIPRLRLTLAGSEVEPYDDLQATAQAWHKTQGGERQHAHAEAIHARAADWRALERAAVAPMQHYAFAQACAVAFPTHDDLYAVTAVDAQGSAVGLAALRATGAGFGRLETLGAAELGEPIDALYDGPLGAQSLASALIRQKRPVRLNRVPADSALIPALAAAVRGRGVCITRTASASPSIELDAGWEAPETKFNAGRRSDFRRAQRHAAQLGEVSYEVLAPTPEQTLALIEEAFTVEMRSWKVRAGTALGIDTLRGNFFRRYALAASAQGTLRIVFLRIDGRAIGMQIALECNQRFWLFKIGYDEAYAKCSPGTLLMLHTLKYAAQHKLASYELLGSAEPWTQMWTTAQRSCVEIRLYPLNWRGLGALALDGWSWGKGRLARRAEDADA